MIQYEEMDETYTRPDFRQKLKNHDWTFEYSDDVRYWRAGRRQLDFLQRAHNALECPFDFRTLQSWAYSFILEDFEYREDENPRKTGYFRKQCRYQNIAPMQRNELITREKFNEIEDWMNEEQG
jgi:hypothetical protein